VQEWHEKQAKLLRDNETAVKVVFSGSRKNFRRIFILQKGDGFFINVEAFQ